MAQQSGRTTRALAALPDGAIYLVVHQLEVQYCRGLLADAGRDPQSIRLVTLAEIPDRLMGLPRSTVLDVDHFVFEVAERREREQIKFFMQRYRLPPTAPEEGPQGRTAARSRPAGEAGGDSGEDDRAEARS